MVSLMRHHCLSVSPMLFHYECGASLMIDWNKILDPHLMNIDYFAGQGKKGLEHELLPRENQVSCHSGES